MDKNKGQKIIAALYLITNHLSDNDPLRTALRTSAVRLTTNDTTAKKEAVQSIDALLGGAVLAQLVSEKNASIIMLELRHFISAFEDRNHQSINELFTPLLPTVSVRKKTADSMSLRTTSPSSLSVTNRTVVQPLNTNDNKNTRPAVIMSFINDRKSAGIKDIAALFPDVSEKTIQRELGSLVSTGMITKRGSKRWSIYMAVGA